MQTVQKIGESIAQFLDAVFAVLVVANDRNEWVQTVQKTVWKCRKCSTCGCGRLCGHAATSPSTKSWTASVFFQAFHAFFAPFRRKRGPRALTAVSGRGLLGVPELLGVVLQGDSAP